MNKRQDSRTRGFLGHQAVAAGAALLLVATVSASAAGPSHQVANRNFDARDAVASAVAISPEAAQLKGVERLRMGVSELTARYDERLGVTRTLSNPTGFLTGPSDKKPMEVALDFIAENLVALGLQASDVDDLEVTDVVPSSVSGVTHIYFRQRIAGIPSYNSQLHVNVTADGRVLSVNNAFSPGVAAMRLDPTPALSAPQAVAAAAGHLGLAVPTPLALSSKQDDARQETLVSHAGISLEPIKASLMWLPIQRGESRLVWNFQIQTLDKQHWFDMNVDANDGKVWTRFDWTSDAQYRVYAQPVESPIHTTPAPPSDARTLSVNPQASAPTPSPNGWHNTGSTSFTITRGNNVHAYEDSDGNNAPPASQVDCGATLNCDFAINLSGAPSTYRPAAVSNLFYWNNIIHDVQYGYGFNEVAGNFQVNNFGRGGAGNDDVQAEAQDGGGNCNANFATPVDGGRPRMQMYTCTNVSPTRDGDLDNGVIVHEYGHGISIRQVGGPGNSSCLNNSQQPGEGWSDWFGLVYTAEAGDAGTDRRGIGSYLFGLAPDGTIRPQNYSTSSAINTYTYASIAGQSIPHGVGSVWAQAIWEVYWALVGAYGFDPDLYDATGGAGNQRAMLYVNEGLKSTACSPSFLDTRDGIIAAATSINGGADVCLIWQAFAAFGLGTNASTPGGSSTSATNGFNVPTSCACTSFPAAPTGLTATPNGNNRIDLAWSAVSGATSYLVFRSTTSGGPYTQIASVTTTTYANTGLTAGTTYYYVVQAVNASGCPSANSNQASATATGPACTTTTLYTRSFETGTGLDGWTRGAFSGTNVADWRGIQTCTAQGGTKIFRFGGTSCTGNYSSNRFNFAQPNGAGGITVPAGSNTTRLTFGHRWRYESGFDGGTLTVSLDGTNYTLVPSSAIISGQNYNGTVAASCAPAGSAGASIFTGVQTAFVNTTVDLDAACVAAGAVGGCGGQAVRIGYTSVTDCSVTDDGWFLDNVTVTACTP